MTPEFSRPVAVSSLGRAEREFAIEAGRAEREALARRFSIPAIDRLDATLVLSPHRGGDVVRLRGTLVAEVEQTCVVTLEPVAARIEETFERVYSRTPPSEAREIDLALDEEDPPDPIVDGVIDIGEAVAEHLALSLDPFPRAPGAVFEGCADDDPVVEETAGAFPELAARLKK